MMSLWDALRMNMMISYQELVRTFPNNNVKTAISRGHAMNDQMFVETLIITSSFFAIAVVLVLSVLLIERTG
ncbi:hypothetical protein BT09F21_47550 [Escherichia coli]